MKRTAKTIISSIILTGILLFVFFIWYIPEKSNSYSEPNEALLATDPTLLLIPGYKINDQSLYFFIKDKSFLGAAYVHEGLLGWKAGMLTWSPMGGNFEDGELNRSQGHGDKLIYGLLKDAGVRFIEVNGERARLLNLQMLEEEISKEYHLENMYLWYYESDTPIEQKEIELFDQNTVELIDPNYL